MTSIEGMERTRRRTGRALALLAAFLVGAFVIGSAPVTRILESIAGTDQDRDRGLLALWFDSPAQAARGLRAGTPVAVVIANRSGGARTVEWAASSDTGPIDGGRFLLAGRTEKSIPVSTDGVRIGERLRIELVDQGAAINAWIVP